MQKFISRFETDGISILDAKMPIKLYLYLEGKQGHLEP